MFPSCDLLPGVEKLLKHLHSRYLLFCSTIVIGKELVPSLGTDRDIYSGHFPPPILSKNGEEFEGGLEKRKGKGGKRRKKITVIKHTLKYLYGA